MQVGFGRYSFVAVSQNDCNSVKRDFSPQLEGTDWLTYARRRISTSGEESLIQRFQQVCQVGSYLLPGSRVLPSSRRTGAKSPSNRRGAALMKSGCAGVTEVAPFR